LPNYDPNAVYANCLGKYSYRYLGAVNLQKKAKEPYPGDRVVATREPAACRSLAPKFGKTSWSDVSKSMWHDENTFVFCWEGS